MQPDLPVRKALSVIPVRKVPAWLALLVRRDVPVLPEYKAWREALALPVRRWLVLPVRPVIPALLVRKAQPDIPVHKATLKWAEWLAVLATPVTPARRGRSVRPAHGVPSA